ncbi:TetR/AcrR family transcriptional regulator [Halorubrum ezzemoulense]|uniref:TetR family transcriptional regulator n=1 Tax=Halorubrum ezzemoulense TaxID=337243 RepID=A0A256J6P1_HALEZ|nr:TetR/AcrR family transcriptional regulator [Halorubrum ezzemoulense]OYR63997.1 TetR family transcriptional regulator [Halorubrum ezzemoulense]OYR68725.1 TetR family transcriptional regulator [Halorubrum ezzemoulense]OYR77702.1 TetR family transcriptional regulator [Halorubrum ezzemoulense]QAY20700.1 TetR family transcriptional regulator [Halorubrum ezzemoulense]
MSDAPSAAEEIMDGVYSALRAHGYADLTMQDIADECSKSKSLLHYHYDTKEDLLVAFLDYVVTDSEERIAARADDPPVERLVQFVGWFVFAPDEADREAFHIALLELRTQGPFNERIREQLARSDRLLRGTVADILGDGIDAGVFRDIDAEETAALLVATLDGARTRQITLAGAGRDDDAAGYTREVAEATLRRIVGPLLAEGVELPPLDESIDALRGDADPDESVDDDGAAGRSTDPGE